MKNLARVRPTILSVLLLLIISEGRAQYTLQEAYPNLPAFTLPLEIVNADDGTSRMFIVQQRGIVYVFEHSGSVSTRKAFLNISDRVSSSGSETGLLGLAFHPQYETNGYFYVNYTNTVGGQLRSYVARYQVSSSNPDSAMNNSELILLTVDQPFSNHNGGKLAFGPDGFLYISFGDGGSGNDPGNRAQNRTLLLGKLLRIDVNSTSGGLNYALPPSNPYVGNSQGYREEIYAYGLRNPWKFSFDSETGKLWLGDVGQDAREEIDIVVSGGNYGWRLMEGFVCTPATNPSCQDTAGLLRPVWDYLNGSGSGADGSITGGYVYRGSAIPSLFGKYVYADYISGRIWALTYDGVNPATNELLLDSPYSVSTFGEDQNRELLVVSYSGTSGRVYRLTGPATSVQDPPVNQPVTVTLQQNYPNPFNPSTTIRVLVDQSRFVTLTVFDGLGREVATLYRGTLHPGEHSFIFEPKELSSGIFLLRLEAEGSVQTTRMVYLR